MVELDGSNKPDLQMIPPWSLREFRQIVREDITKRLQIGDTWYLIALEWWEKFRLYIQRKEEEDGDDFIDPADIRAHGPGKINNLPLLALDQNENGNDSESEENDDNYIDVNSAKMNGVNEKSLKFPILKNYLMERLDFVVVPEQTWLKLVAWFGSEEPEQGIARKVVMKGVYSAEVIVEVYPPLFKLELLLGENQNSKTRQCSLSRYITIKEVYNQVRDIFNIDSKVEIRLWLCKGNKRKRILDQMEKTFDYFLDEREDTILIEMKGEGQIWAEVDGENISEGTASFDDRMELLMGRSYPAITYGSSPEYPSTMIRNFDSNGGGPSISGLCGLMNLGNTCFMNSALQCLSNTPLLRDYFLSDKYREELNTTNPLGMNGDLAQEYGTLIKQLWKGNSKCIAPRNFKYSISHFAPQFSGYQQHDSQELLAFLLDGLHEDLNRIKNKPYVELKDSHGRPDAAVAIEAWENHKKRNDSIIVDLFQGQFKSTLVCPECNRISITFDPFMYLSLPLPVTNVKLLTITVVFKMPSIRIVKYRINVPKRGSVTDLKNKLSELTGIQPKNLILADIFEGKFYEIIFSKSMTEIKESDNIFAYEVAAYGDENDMVNIKLLIRSISNTKNFISYQRIEYSEIPFILSVPSTADYNLVYEEVLRCISLFTPINLFDEVRKSEHASMNIVEQPSQPSNSTQGFFSKLSCNALQADTFDQDEKPFIILRITDNSGQDRKHYTPQDTTSAIRFTSFCLAADFESEDFDRLFKSDEALIKTRKLIDMHESMHHDRHHEGTKSVTLRECLDLFTKPEKLNAENLWYCSNCQKHQEASKKLDLWSLPDILVIHLKRFSYNRYSRDKLDTFVDFPILNLVLGDFVKNPLFFGQFYNLYAISNHFGGLGGGHYTAYARNEETGKWYNFDDSYVSPVEEANIKTNNAYVLFYRRLTRNTDSTFDKMNL